MQRGRHPVLTLRSGGRNAQPALYSLHHRVSLDNRASVERSCARVRTFRSAATLKVELPSPPRDVLVLAQGRLLPASRRPAG